MAFSDDDLISYLLGDADEGLFQRIEAALPKDPELVARIKELRSILGHLDSYGAVSEPPPDLVDRTLTRIDAARDADQELGFEDREEDHALKPEATFGEGAEKVRLNTASMTEGSRSKRAQWDTMALSLAVLVLCSLLLPTMLRARFESRRIQCSYNLYELGRGLVDLALLDRSRRFPSVPDEGPRAFAGIYAIQLRDALMLDSPSQVYCPSLPPARDEVRLVEIPTSEMFDVADVHQQSVWRRGVGGSYAYNLGVMERGQLRAPQLEGRTHFAILGDAPRGWSRVNSIFAHEGRGYNIFYEDGHVRFISLPDNDSRTVEDRGINQAWRGGSPAIEIVPRASNRTSNAATLPESAVTVGAAPTKPIVGRSNLQGGLSASESIEIETASKQAAEADELSGEAYRAWWQDHPYRNLRGIQAAGLTPNDASLAPSSIPPRGN